MRRVPLRGETLPEEEGAHLDLPERAAHYVRDVLRMKKSDRLEIFNGEGVSLFCSIISIGSGGVTLVVEEIRYGDPHESPLYLELYQAIPKGDRWEWILEKACELGVDRIIPLMSTRTVVRIRETKRTAKLDRWQRVVDGAARQSGRTVIAEVSSPLALEQAIERADFDRGLHLVATPHGEREGATHWLQGQQRSQEGVALWVGPEGGWSEEETSALVEAGAKPLGLGPRILRAETAAIAALALAQALCGDLH